MELLDESRKPISGSASWRRRWVSRAADLIGAGQPPHRELDLAARQLAPAFHRAHIGRLGETVEEIARPQARFVARKGKGLAQIAVLRLAPPGHPAGEIARTQNHAATPNQMMTG